jgi:hypothetical protein
MVPLLGVQAKRRQYFGYAAKKGHAGRNQNALRFDLRPVHSLSTGVSVIDVVHPCGEILAWHKAAVVWIQRILAATTNSLWPLKRVVLFVLQVTFRIKKAG